jgi:hypothetical protein
MIDKLPTPDECYEKAKNLSHEILPAEDDDPIFGELVEEWFIYPERIQELITFCQTPKQ